MVYAWQDDADIATSFQMKFTSEVVHFKSDKWASLPMLFQRASNSIGEDVKLHNLMSESQLSIIVYFVTN